MNLKYLILIPAFIMISACTSDSEVIEESQGAGTPEYRSDSETWESTNKTIRMRGCVEWKRANPEADC